MAAAWIDNPTTKKSARIFRKKLSTQGALAGVDPDAGDIAKSATMILIKESARQVVFGPSELVTPLPTYKVVIQAEFVSSVSKARDICRSIPLRPQASLV